MSEMLGSELIQIIEDTNTCLLFLNQLRSTIKMNQYIQGPTEETTGGSALKYYAKLRIKMNTIKTETVDSLSVITGAKEKKPVHSIVRVTIEKNKIDKPFYYSSVFIRYGEGFDPYSSIIEMAINSGV